MKYIFLDIDGPMMSGRCYFSKRGRWDQLAVDAINRLCDETGAKIVFNSTHNIIGNLIGTAEYEGIRSEYIEGKTVYPQGGISRLKAILHFLSDNPATHWVALDDAPIEHNNAIAVSPENGLLVEDYRKACDLLGSPSKFMVLI